MNNKLYMDGTKLNRHLDEVVKWLKGEWFAPIHMEISLNNICNQRCTFCYIKWSRGNINMAEDMVVSIIKDAKRIGVKSALIAGEGEPTLNKVYVKAIQVAGEVGLDIALNTNAVRMNENDLSAILPHLSWMRCSMQASRSELYAQLHQTSEAHFQKAVRNIKNAVEIKHKSNLKVTIGIQQVLLKENIHDVANLARLAKNIGVDYYVIKPCHSHEHNKEYKKINNLVEEYRDILEEAESTSDDKFKAIVRWNFLTEAESMRTYATCLALPFIIQITADGGVYTCYPMSDRKEHLYGSLREHNIKEILKSERYGEIWKWVATNVDVSKCMPTCRQHNANKYLWWLTREIPDHINFI